MSYQKHNFEAGAVLFASQLNDMDNQIEFLSNQGSSFSDDFKTALLNCFENVAWINENGQTYYDALYDSLYPDNMWFITNVLTGCVTSNNATSILKNNSYVATITANQGYTLNGATVNISMGGNDVTSLYYSSGSINIPSVTGDLVITVLASSAVTSISAVFTQGSAVIYTTDNLNTLKQYLVVTATYSDSTTAVTTNYTLSGTLTEGTSTITVSYGGKTTTFTANVTTAPVYQIVEGKHEFSDGSYVEVSNKNHVKVYVNSDMPSPGNGIIVNFSDIIENTNVPYMLGNRDNKSLKFTLPSGSSCSYFIKNVISNISAGLSVGNRQANGTGTVQSDFGFTASGTTWEHDGSGHIIGNYTSTVTASSALEVGSLWANINYQNAVVGAYVEFDVEIYSGTTRYV